MLMVIFGAGASYDSSPDFLPPYTGGGANARHDVLSGITSEGLESYLNFEDIDGYTATLMMNPLTGKSPSTKKNRAATRPTLTQAQRFVIRSEEQ